MYFLFFNLFFPMEANAFPPPDHVTLPLCSSNVVFYKSHVFEKTGTDHVKSEVTTAPSTKRT
jgi:hypothetical protein